MSIKILNLYILPDKEIEKMFKLIEFTNEFNQEYAGRICRKKENFELKIINAISGNSYCVQVPKRCISGYKSIGLFHTHVSKKGKDIISLSIPDIENHILSKHIVDFLGVDNKILCYTRKKIKNFDKNITRDIGIIRTNIQLAKKEFYDESTYIRNMRSNLSAKLASDYFNIMEIKKDTKCRQ